MSNSIFSVISGTGKYIPTERIPNQSFLNNEFHDTQGTPLNSDNEVILEKFEAITTIAERRYVSNDLTTSDIAYLAAEDALQSSNTDRESLDYVIVAHNFGDVKNGNLGPDIVPSLAARVKQKLGIANPETVAYDLPFGCPGWLQAMIQADYFIRSGDAKKILVIGAEVLSRVADPHDRDSMIYADGAGATILSARESDQPVGILKHKTRSDTLEYADMLFMGKSYKSDDENENLYIKMHGRKLYSYALQHVPQAIKACLDQSGTDITEVKKILIHQANGKMDEAILERLYHLYGIEQPPSNVMPMTVSWLGNSSVATVPTLLDLITKGDMPDHEINPGDKVVFASVGAGMNINAMLYQA